MRKHNKAFTLIELIIVITMLAILMTIAFISLQGFLRDARNSIRQSDIESIVQKLELSSLLNGEYPDPSNYTTVKYLGTTVWYQGTFGEEPRKTIGLSNSINDPLTNNKYTYSLNSSKDKYLLATIQEGMNGTAFAFIQGTYKGIIALSKSFSTTYILSLPSIIASDLSSINLIDIVSNNKLIYNMKNNLPASYSGSIFEVNGGLDFRANTLLVYSGSLSKLKWDRRKRLKFINELQDSYSGTALSLEGNIKTITQADLRNTLKADSLAILLLGSRDTPKISPVSIVFINNSNSIYTCPSCEDIN